MANTLSEKMERVKNDHAAEEFGRIREYQEANAASEAMFILGRIKQNDHLASAISANLSAQTLRALERFQQEKRYEVLGFATFDEFLNNSQYSPMTKRQYYDRLALIRGHGDEIYDLLTSIGISVRSQRLLGKGDLSIRDDQLFIGETAVEVANTGVIKQVLTELFDERRDAETNRAKLIKLNDSLKLTVKTGTEEYNELQRAMDAINEQSPYEHALLGVVSAMLKLAGVIADLPESERTSRGPADLKTVAGQYFQLRDAYGIKTPLAERSVNPQSAIRDPQSDDFDAKLDAAIAEADDLDNEEDFD